MPNDVVYLDGPPEQISRNGTFVGQHIYTPRLGAAVHINAFNFPVWGMLEKLAPALAAGVPAIVKPASSTAYLTELVVRRIMESGILPAGSLQLICGGVGDLFDHLNCQDTIAFTGSKSTAEKLQRHPRVVSESVAFTAETDSLNASILGPDAVPGTPEFDIYVKEVVREMTSKAGQKCTAIRRIIAPAAIAGDLVDDVAIDVDVTAAPGGVQFPHGPSGLGRGDLYDLPALLLIDAVLQASLVKQRGERQQVLVDRHLQCRDIQGHSVDQRVAPAQLVATACVEAVAQGMKQRQAFGLLADQH